MHLRGVRLRWLMVLIVLLAVLPIFALHLAHLRSSSDEAVERAYEAAAGLASDGAAAHEGVTGQARQLLEVLAQIPAVRSAALPECESILRSVRGARGWVTGIVVTDPNGNGRCGDTAAVRALSIGDRAYFRDARRSGQYQLSNAISGRISRSNIVVAILPLTDRRGEFEAALVAGINLGWINQIAAEASARFSGLLVAYDDSGKLIAYQSGQSDSTGERPLDALGQVPAVRTIIGARGDMFEATDADGVERLFGVARLPESKISVAVGVDRAEILSPVYRSFWQALLLLLLVTGVSIGLALAAAEFGLLRGVRVLKSAALRLKAGRMGLRVRLPRFVAAELQDFAATYNAMTAEFERLAYLDRLTGLPNRRYLERYLAKREGRGQTAAARHAVLAIDIDGFKPVNDLHGHAVGDRVLAFIARRIAAAVDERGLLFRVDGDEFVAIVPLTSVQDRETARRLAEEVRRAMEQAIEFDDVRFPMACSIGIAIVPNDAKTLSAGLVVADGALYEAKRAGRNRVMANAPSLAASMPGIDSRAEPYDFSRMDLG